MISSWKPFENETKIAGKERNFQLFSRRSATELTLNENLDLVEKKTSKQRTAKSLSFVKYTQSKYVLRL